MEKRLPVLLTTDQYETLRRIAFEQRVSISELIRQAIDAWLERKN
jgi:hypothetical protein